MAGGRRYKYDADIEFKAEMTWHPNPEIRNEDTAKGRTHVQNERELIEVQKGKMSWRQMALETEGIWTKVVLTIVGLATLWYLRGSYMSNQTTSMGPFTHSIDPNNPRYIKYMNRNPGMI